VLLNKIQQRVLITICSDRDEKRQIFEDGSNRLNGGSSDFGGLSKVNYNWAGNHWNNRAFRPLVVFKRKRSAFSSAPLA
jgi:hypothetical protein